MLIFNYECNNKSIDLFSWLYL